MHLLHLNQSQAQVITLPPAASSSARPIHVMIKLRVWKGVANWGHRSCPNCTDRPPLHPQTHPIMKSSSTVHVCQARSQRLSNFRPSQSTYVQSACTGHNVVTKYRVDSIGQITLLAFYFDLETFCVSNYSALKEIVHRS